MFEQPILNLGCLGSVSDGKSTMVKLLSGKSTQTHSKEKVRNITMKVGYANTKFWKSKKDNTLTSSYSDVDNSETHNLIHHVSFVDCPGHHDLLEVMMSGAMVMDGGIVVVSGNESIENKPQLKQHIITAKLVGLKKIIFILNKLDLVDKYVANERYEDLVNFLKEFDIIDPIIIPMSMSLGLGKENLIQSIIDYFPPSERRQIKTTQFMITRSFDINKNGITPQKFKPGVVGGSLISGDIQVGDEIIISPGKQKKTATGWKVKEFTTKVVSLKSEKDSLDKIYPGGLTAIGTEIDPYYTMKDKLKGNIIFKKSENYQRNIYYEIDINLKFVEWNKEYFELIKKDKILTLQIGANTLVSKVISINNTNEETKLVKFILERPICVLDDQNILVCDKVDGNHLSIIAYGKVESGQIAEIIA